MPTHSLPKQGRSHEQVMAAVHAFAAEDPEDRFGHMSCYAMHGSPGVKQVIHDAYSVYFHKNSLIRRYFPGYERMETELLEIGAGLLGGGVDGVRTFLTNGGTESIFCGVHAAREWARARYPHIAEPEFVAPYSLHPTFSKAGHYLGVKIRRIPLGPDHRADPAAIAAAIGPNTIGLAGSAPCWPYGLVDPIEELAAIAADRGLWMHTDACVGGFFLPFAAKAGHDVPRWDFSAAGVMSISADLHKYGYAAKPCSMIAFRDESLLDHHYVFPDEWPSSKYMAQAFSGSRPAGATAAAWAALHFLGEDGYVDLARRTIAGKRALAEGLRQIDGLEPWETDAGILVYGSNDPKVPVQQIVGGLTRLGWKCGGTLEPPLVHLVLDAISEADNEAYLRDVRRVVDAIRAGREIEEGSLSYVD